MNWREAAELAVRGHGVFLARAMSLGLCQKTHFLSFLFGNTGSDFESSACTFKKDGGDQHRDWDPSFAVRPVWIWASGGSFLV